MRPIRRTQQEPFGLVGWLEKTKISLPLKGVECRFEVSGDVINVEIDQVYHQNATQPLDCLYSFPLPAEAAVYRCELHVNDRIIRAKVEEQTKAREMFEQKKAQGRRAALVEVERDNLFTLSLGNLQPDDVVVVRFAYCQTLERLGDEMSLRIPVCPGVRYVPGKPLLRDLSGRGACDDTDRVPDASRISPPRLDALDPGAAYFSMGGKIDSALAVLESIASPTHPVVVRMGDEAFGIMMAQRDAVPDCDFVLRWKERAESRLAPHAWTFRDGGNNYGLVQLRAPQIAQPASDLEQDVYFLIDRSGSMSGLKWTKTCQALRAFVEVLGERDRAWITFFESTHRDFAEIPQPASVLSKDRALRSIESLGTGGGTELLPALEHVLQKVDLHSADRRAILLLITDGQIGNEGEVLAQLRIRSKLTTHVFGIDTAVNDAFLKQVAKQQRGQCFLQTPNDDIAGTVAKLAGLIRRPVLTDITISAGWQTPNGRAPDLYSGEVIDVCVRATGDKAALKIVGRLADGTMQTFDFHLIPVTNPALRLMWARERIDALLAESRNAEAIELAKSVNIICRGAAFIAWDEAGEEVAVAVESIYQPSIEPLIMRASETSEFSFVRFARQCGRPRDDFRYFVPPSRGLENFLEGVVPDKKSDLKRVEAIRIRYKQWRKLGDADSGRKLLDWRTAIRSDMSKFTNASALLDLFCYWAVADENASVERWIELQRLKVEIATASSTNANHILAICRVFADRHFRDDEQLSEDFTYLLTEFSRANA